MDVVFLEIFMKAILKISGKECDYQCIENRDAEGKKRFHYVRNVQFFNYFG